MHRARVLSMLLASLLLASCGDSAPADVPKASPGHAACAPGELALSDGRCQPAGLPPDMPCPPGQRALADGSCQAAGVPPEACAAGKFLPDGQGGCTPILPQEACPAGLMAVPGEKACREVWPCGDGTWGAIPVDATTQYVDQHYPGDDSNGTQQRPWKTVQAGVNAAAIGAIVAVAEGRYAEDVLIAYKAVRLWGRCPARTQVVGQGGQPGAVNVAYAQASGTEIRGLAVTGLRDGVVVDGAHPVILEGLWVHETNAWGVLILNHAGVTVRGALLEQNRGAGMLVPGSDVTVESTVVRATQPDGTGKYGRGISIQPNPDTGVKSTLLLTGSLIEQNRQFGVFATGSDATVEATVVRETQPDLAGNFGRGISGEVYPAGAGSQIAVRASVVEQNHGMGVFGSGSEVTVETTVVRENQPNVGGESGVGVQVQADLDEKKKAKLSLTASLIDNNHDSGVFIETSEATLDGTIVRATQPDSDGMGGRGVAAQPNAAAGSEGGKLSVKASLIDQNHDVGVFVGASEATIESTVVRATHADGSGTSARGINVQMKSAAEERGRLSLESSLVEDNEGIGLFVGGSEATVASTVVRGTLPEGGGLGGRGIDVEDEPGAGQIGELTLTASLIEQNREIGLFVGASEATVEATVVRATQPNGAGDFGVGIGVVARPGTGPAGKLSLTSSLIDQCQSSGLLIDGSEVTISSTAVRGTKQAPGEGDFGDGIAVLDDSRASHAVITATESTGNARAGVLYIGSSGELSGVRSSGNRFGLVLQPGKSAAQPTLGKGNVFEGNTEHNEVLGGNLSVPDAVPPIPP